MKFVAYIEIEGEKQPTEERLQEIIVEALTVRRSEFSVWPFGSFAPHVHVEVPGKQWLAGGDDY